MTAFRRELRTLHRASLGLAAAVLIVAAGCEDGGDDGLSTDVGSNDPGIVVALGDSITEGVGAVPYPSLLAPMIGKVVINGGRGGDRAASAANRVGGLLGNHPGYITILLGSNDAIHGADTAQVKESLRNIINAARANQTVCVIATLPPMVRGHEIFNPAAQRVSQAIRELASEENVRLVDLEAAFNPTPEQYLDSDGLHPNQAGQELIAARFASVF